MVWYTRIEHVISLTVFIADIAAKYGAPVYLDIGR